MTSIYEIYRNDTTENKENFNNWIEKTIDDYLPIRDKEKNKYGEVFTPRILIDEMMDKLNEIDPSVFKNKELKWLDPANGVGNFPLIVYGKLMEGLKSSITDEYERSEHILRNMLYMVELQVDNYEVSRKLFSKHANIFCGSFLTTDNKSINPNVSKKFKVDKYDIIIGNPPFQKPREKEDGTTAGRGQLWPIFTKESLNLLKNENSLLCFIHPQNWRRPEHKLWEEMTQERQLHFIKILNEDEGKKQFKASTKADIYILQNKPIFTSTEIIDENGKKHNLDLKKLYFLPNSQFKNIQKILSTKENGIDVIYDTKYHTQKILTTKENGIDIIHNSFYQASKYLKENEDYEYKFPVVHTITRKGLGIRFSKFKKGHFGIPKVLLNFGRHQYPYNDYDGKYGMSQITFGIPISSKEEGDLIVKAINTPEFKEIIKATKWGAFQTDYRMFKYFKKDFWKEF